MSIKQKGEAAGTKLMVPTAMIFLGILVLIIVPVIGDSIGMF